MFSVSSLLGLPVNPRLRFLGSTVSEDERMGLFGSGVVGLLGEAMVLLVVLDEVE